MNGRYMHEVAIPMDSGLSRAGLFHCSFATEELTLVAGCTGSGKSTLLQLLAGLRPAGSGNIGERRGEEQRTLERRELLATSSYVYQNPEQMFFLPTVREEILYSLKQRRLPPQERQERLVWASAWCGLGEELWERSAFTLSGGEKRRTALAAAAAIRQPWLLLDEPTAGLDPVMAASLAGELAEWKREQGRAGGGIVIASHELDLFLPLADRVVLLKDGSVAGQWSPQELLKDPSPLTEAGLGVPDCIRLAALAGSDSLAAEAIARSLAEKLAAGSSAIGAQPYAAGATQTGQQPAIRWTVRSQPNQETRFSRLSGLDPRAKWLLYALFSLSLLVSPHWGVTALGGMAVAGLGLAANIPAKRWLRPVFAFGSFILAAFVISGVELSFAGGQSPLIHVGFSWGQGQITLKRLTPLLPVLAGGVLFNILTPPLSIQKGMEELLRRIPVIRRAGDTIGLAVALLFRFIRFLPGELGRMALLASIRGRPGSGNPGKLKLRQLPAFFIPLLLSMLHHAEELSFALAARGYGRKGAKRTQAAPLRWQRSDGAACLAGMLCIAGMNVLRLFF
ncbi:ATP-binding cassette domain-containing protein [Paenibacillus mesotrionivorans]|uniref:ATP-binding cassette domain-containing protein n=1 Tax=Paenibacillus mesotrionivorans TaxID=3160968 RepID=A0ACC7P3X9_9BACL